MKFPFLWLLPFLFFISGYFLIARLVTVESLQTPRVVGLLLHDALQCMSASQLQGQIIATKEEPDLPDGLVLDQTPHPGQQIKITQPIYLTIARKPAPIQAPQLAGLQIAALEQKAHAHQMKVKVHELEGSYPVQSCFGQYPAAGQPVAEQTVDVYVSAGMTPVRIFPLCKGLPIDQVQTFCKQMGMTVQVFHAQKVAEGHTCEACVVQEQKPLAGTLFDIHKPLIVQLIAG